MKLRQQTYCTISSNRYPIQYGDTPHPLNTTHPIQKCQEHNISYLEPVVSTALWNELQEHKKNIPKLLYHLAPHPKQKTLSHDMCIFILATWSPAEFCQQSTLSQQVNFTSSWLSACLWICIIVQERKVQGTRWKSADQGRGCITSNPCVAAFTSMYICRPKFTQVSTASSRVGILSLGNSELQGKWKGKCHTVLHNKSYTL